MNNEKKEGISQVERGETTKTTEGGVWLERKEMKDNRLIYERKRKFIDSEHPAEGIKDDYEKEFSYDSGGNLIREIGKDFVKGNAWQKDFGWQNGQMVSEDGRITKGPDDGHEWKTSFERDTKGRVLVERGEILEQGKNPQKLEKGHVWQKKHLFDDDGKWRGAVGKKKNPDEDQWTVWTEGKVSQKDVAEVF